MKEATHLVPPGPCGALKALCAAPAQMFSGRFGGALSLLRSRLSALAPAPRVGSFLAARSLFVSMESTPNPDSVKFVPEDKVVLPESLGSGLHFSSAAEARGSKLVRALLKHGDITGVFLGRDFISVNKRESATWQPLKVIVVDAIMDAYAELEAKGTPIVEEPAAAADTQAQPEDSEVVAMIKELIETRIRPAVQEDGGDIFFECVPPLPSPKPLHTAARTLQPP